MMKKHLIVTVGMALATAAFADQNKEKPEFRERPVPSLSGETGLFKVLEARTLCLRQVSVQIAAENWDRDPGRISYDEATLSFAYGLTDKLEVSLAFRAAEVKVRQDPAEAPVYFRGNFLTGPVKEKGTGNPHIGVKYNFLTERAGRPGLAAHVYLDLPRSDEETVLGTGKTEYGATLIASKKLGPVAASLNAGYVRFDESQVPNKYPINDWITYGVGARFPAGRPLQVVAEMWGYSLAERAKVTPEIAAQAALDGITLTVGDKIPDEGRLYYHLGAQWQWRNGLTFAAAARYTSIDDIPSGSMVSDNNGVGFIAKVSYTSGCKVRAPRPAEPEILGERQAAQRVARADVEMENLPPRLKIEPEMLVVRAGERINLRALGEDPEGEDLKYSWAPERGRIVGDGENVMWEAPLDDCDKPIVIRARATDPHGAAGSDSVVLRVICPEVPPPAPAAERIFFDFDSFVIRPEAAAQLAKVAEYLKANPKATVVVEGHTCNMGTESYNMALGQRRAEAARRWLIERGIAANRITAASYGLTRPAYDNASEGTRKFNRRAEFVFSRVGAKP